MRRILSGFLVFILFFAFQSAVFAQEAGQENVTTSHYQASVYATEGQGLAFKESPDINSGRKGVIPEGTELTIDGVSNGWGYTQYNGMYGWIFLKYTRIIGTYPTERPSWGMITPAYYTVYNTLDEGLELRSRPTSECSTFGPMMDGTVVLVEAVQDNWAFTSYKGNYGWAHMNYLRPASGWEIENAQAAMREQETTAYPASYQDPGVDPRIPSSDPNSPKPSDVQPQDRENDGPSQNQDNQVNPDNPSPQPSQPGTDNPNNPDNPNPQPSKPDAVNPSPQPSQPDAVNPSPQPSQPGKDDPNNQNDSSPSDTGDGTWTCSNGHEGNTDEFCPKCGEHRPEQNSAQVLYDPADTLSGSEWYQYIHDVLGPEKGYASLNQTERYLNGDMEQEGGWDVRSGIAAALILDFTGNGREDLVLFYFSNEGESNYMYRNYPDTYLYAQLYMRDDSGNVYSTQPQLMFNDTNFGYRYSRVGVMKFNGECYLYTESSVFGYFIVGTYPLNYNWYRYDGTALRKQWLIGQTAGGSDEIAYSLRTFTYADIGNGADDRAGTGAGSASVDGTDTVAEQYTDLIIYGDESYKYYHPEVTPLLWSIGSSEEVAKAGFEQLGLPQPVLVALPYEDSARSIYSYWGTDITDLAIEYLCYGTKNGISRYMNITITDHTNLMEHVMQYD